MLSIIHVYCTKYVSYGWILLASSVCSFHAMYATVYRWMCAKHFILFHVTKDEYAADIVPPMHSVKPISVLFADSLSLSSSLASTSAGIRIALALFHSHDYSLRLSRAHPHSRTTTGAMSESALQCASIVRTFCMCCDTIFQFGSDFRECGCEHDCHKQTKQQQFEAHKTRLTCAMRIAVARYTQRRLFCSLSLRSYVCVCVNKHNCTHFPVFIEFCITRILLRERPASAASV